MCDRKIGPFDCCSVVQGDCFDLMAQLNDGVVDAVISDPPYQVGMAKWDALDVAWLHMAWHKGKIVAFTPGIANANKYPQPDWIICWAKQGSTRRNATGGFNHWEPVLYYGKRRIMVDFINLPTISNIAPEDYGHPCPKPLKLAEELIEKLTDQCDTVLDPFLGSGTTAVAAKKLGRHFLGFEISEDYCEIARERLARIDAQPRLFEPRAEQLTLNG